MSAENPILVSDTDLLYDPARYTGLDPVIVDNDNDTVGLSSSFISTVNNKLDASTFNAYSEAHANDDVTPYTGGTGISVSNHQISCTGDLTAYTGGTGISVSNHQISCTGDITAYTAGSNISISNHVVSGKDWSSDISSAINTALANYQTKLTGITDVQVVTELPASPVANVLYLVKE